MLVGREAECARLDGLIADARAGISGVLFLRGQAGIGKSALLAYAGEQAAPMAVRQACGVEAEIGLAFASLADIVKPELARLGELPASQAAALAGALSLGPSVPNSRFAVGAATLTLLATAAGEAGLLVTVDDAQWLDPSTAETLAFAARRLEAEGVLLLFALRDGEPSVLNASGHPEMRVEGLRRSAADALLARHGEIAPHIGERLHRVARGNPLALRELPSMLSSSALSGEAPMDEPLRVGRRVTEVFSRRVAQLPRPTHECLLLLAASETSSTVTLAAAVEAAGLDLAALEAAELAHLVTLDGHRVEFVHPLLRSVIYQRATSAERRGAHRVLADTAAVGEDDRRALHLGRAAAGRDEHIARGIEGAALAARERGGTSASARAFEAAANLTPAPEERARRRIEAARDHQLVGNSETSTALLQQAIAETTDAVLRADAELLQARAQAWRGETGRAFETLRLQALGVEAADPARAAALLTDAAVIATIRGQYRTQVMTARAAVSAAERAGTSAVVAAEIVLAHGLANVGRGDEAQQLLRRRGSDLGSGDPLAGSALLQLAGFAWMCLGNDVRARRFLDRAIGSLRDAGALGALPFVLASRSMLDHRTGRWRNAVADAGESVALAEQVGHEAERPFYLVCLAAIEATRGNDRECREHLATAEALCERFEVDSVLPWMEAARGSLELGQGRYEEAVGALERIPALAERLAIGEPSLVLWQPDLIEAYVRTGRLDGAARVLGELERQAEATGRVWAQATAARCRGLLADDTDVEEHFEAALAWHEQLSAPFELARTQLCLGERLGMRRRPLDARRSLAAATDTFQRLGADPWARRARRELARNGGSPGPPADPGLAQLTPQEVQVALAVAEGASNKEVAAALFLSTKTIEFHLGNTYRKLGLRSRTQLARLISK